MNSDSHSTQGWPAFATTHWSVVHKAGQEGSPSALEALAQLCRTYWYPLYAHIRRKGYSAHDAQDLAQEFFSRLLAGNTFRGADQNKGKFRSFLLGSLEHFLAREWTKAHAQKRGGGQPALSLDAMDVEGRFLLEPADEQTADKVFDHRWAMALLERAVKRLREECQDNQRGDLFEKLKPAVFGDKGEGSYRDLAQALNLTEGAVKVTVHRLRRRYGELVREEIAQTVATPQDADEELRYFASLLRVELP